MRPYIKKWREAKKAALAADDIIDRHATAALLGVNVRTLQRWHHDGYGPKRLSGRGHLSVLYRRSEVEEWMSTKMQHLHGHPTQESGGVDVH